MGVYKISSTEVLKNGEKLYEVSNFLIGENLPVNESDIQYYNLGDNYFYEINTIMII